MTSVRDAGAVLVEPNLDEATHEDVRRLEENVMADVVVKTAAVDAEPVAIACQGRLVFARPVDNLAFVRAMAPHICFN